MIISYVAAILELIAKWTVGNKDRWGFIIHLISGLLWSYIALKTGLYALLIITLPATVINVRNFIKWSRK